MVLRWPCIFLLSVYKDKRHVFVKTDTAAHLFVEFAIKYNGLFLKTQTSAAQCDGFWRARAKRILTQSIKHRDIKPPV